MDEKDIYHNCEIVKGILIRECAAMNDMKMSITIAILDM